jgi:hypothetical protein
MGPFAVLASPVTDNFSEKHNAAKAAGCKRACLLALVSFLHFAAPLATLSALNLQE